MTGLSQHGRVRCQQRGVSEDDIAFALRYGRVLHAAGAQFVFVGRRDIPADAQRVYGHIEGLTLVLYPSTNLIITTYRNRRSLARLKRKPRSSRP